MKAFRVSSARTIVIEGSFIVEARSENGAIETAENMAKTGDFGSIRWAPKGAGQAITDAELDSEDETIEISEASLED